MDHCPDNNEIKLFYNNINTRQLFDPSKEMGYEKYYKEFDSFLKFIIDKLKLNTMDQLNVIDIDAGNGSTLLQIKDLTNWNSTGVESDKIKHEILNFHKLKVVNDIFQNTSNNLKNDHYDLIIISQVLEHIENPSILLKEINKKLKKNGYLWIDVPLCNNNYFNSRVNDDVGHLYFFDETTLGEILKQSNFHIVSSGSYGAMIEPKRTVLSSVKLFFKYYLHRFLPMSLLNLNKVISGKANKFKNINFKNVYSHNDTKINGSIYEYDKLFMLAKKNN